MSKRYRPWKIDEPMLLPATVQEFVDKDHLARFVLNLVVEEIEFEEIERVYRVDRGQPPFDPAMMTAVLLCGYCNGVYSSRRIAKACRERVDFMTIAGLDPPDFRTISEARHARAWAAACATPLSRRAKPRRAHRRTIASRISFVSGAARAHSAFSQIRHPRPRPISPETETLAGDMSSAEEPAASAMPPTAPLIKPSAA
jgi:transposase